MKLLRRSELGQYPIFVLSPINEYVGNLAAYISPTVENPIKIFSEDDDAILDTSFTKK